MADVIAEYADFLARKAPTFEPDGFDPMSLPAHMTGHWGAAALIAIQRGRCGLFLDTGLGKTTVELEYARQVSEHTGRPCVILCPLAVGFQMEREASRFGYDAVMMRDGAWRRDAPILLANYDRLDAVHADRIGGVVLDESSILKSYTGLTSRALIAKFAGLRYRVAATATPAPNDHMELGQHSEFLGAMASNEMLARWFVSDQRQMGRYRLKGHGVEAFWDWVSSWAVMAETPEDLGFDGSAFVLPPLRIHRHKSAGDVRKPIGGLFAADVSATTIFTVKRHTAQARADAVASLVAAEPDETWAIWCDTDFEAHALMARLPVGAIEIRGSHSARLKEESLIAFQTGERPYLVSKPSVCGMGLNFQHCARQAFVGRSFSYEAWYRTVRRCWRYGQTRPVDVHIIVAEGEEQIGRVIDTKAEKHALMKRAMRDASRRRAATSRTVKMAYQPEHQGRLPTWLCA